MAEPRQRASFGRVIATPIIVLVAAFMLGLVIPGSMLAALAVGAIVSIVYILVASRR